MPTRQNQYVNTITGTGGTLTITGVSAGSSNNRAIFVGTAFILTGDEFVTNVTFGGTALTRGTNATNFTNDLVGVTLWYGFGVTSVTTNVVVSLAANNIGNWGAAVVTYSDASSIESYVTDGIDQGDVTNTLSTDNTRAALSFWGAQGGNPTLAGSTGHSLLTNALTDGSHGVGCSAVDPASNSTVMGFQTGGNDISVISFDIAGPPAATNLSMVGFG